jgi:hypothetical protein
MIIYIIGFIAILALLYVVRNRTTEHLLIYDVNVDMNTANIIYDDKDYSKKIVDELSFVINFVRFNKEVNNGNTLYITDALSYDHYHKTKDTKVHSICEDEKTFLMIKKRDMYIYETLPQVVKHRKVIGYPSEIHRQIFLHICNSNNIDVSLLNLKKTNNLNDVDVLLFFDSLYNNYDYDNLIDFVPYEFDIKIIKHLIPFCKIKNVSLPLYFKNYKDRYPTKACIVIDFLIYAHKDFKIARPPIKTQTVPKNNFFSKFFEFFEYEQIIQDKHQILEKFSDGWVGEDEENITIIAEHAIPGFLHIETKEFKHRTKKINGVPLQKNMIIILKFQQNLMENGTYQVSEDYVLKKIEKIDEDPKNDDRYECKDYPDIKNKESCKTIWDKRCEKDRECPFFQKNRHYDNYFGGCHNGYCQMPVGVERTSYRTYNKNSKAYCHGGECDAKNPNYAFELDLYEKK